MHFSYLMDFDISQGDQDINPDIEMINVPGPMSIMLYNIGSGDGTVTVSLPTYAGGNPLTLPTLDLSVPNSFVPYVVPVPQTNSLTIELAVTVTGSTGSYQIQYGC